MEMEVLIQGSGEVHQFAMIEEESEEVECVR